MGTTGWILFKFLKFYDNRGTTGVIVILRDPIIPDLFFVNLSYVQSGVNFKITL